MRRDERGGYAASDGPSSPQRGMAAAVEGERVVVFFVPGPPQGKGRPRIVRIAGHARMAAPSATVAYEGLIALAAREAMAGTPPFTGAVSLWLAIDCPIPASWSKRKQWRALAGKVLPTTKPDCDNVVKAVCDGLNGVAWRDDVQVVDLAVRKRYAATPGLRVEIMSATDEAARTSAPVQPGPPAAAMETW